MCGCAKLCVCTGNLIGLVASKLRFNKVWNKQEKYFQWNMLVIDKAKEAIYGVEQSIVRKVQSWERKEE